MPASEDDYPVSILLEGDSWFNLPDYLWPADIKDVLGGEFDVESVAIWSDTLENMVSKRQYMQKLDAGLRRHFLFSGGGNDILGSIEKYVRPRRSGDKNSVDVSWYVRPEFGKRINELVDLFDYVASDIRSVRDRRIIMYVHGYANAIPKKNKKYLGIPFERIGFETNQYGKLAAQIVAHMVAIYNERLMRLAAKRSNIVHVDLRTVMRASDWNSDEIHPNKTGAARCAKKFAQRIYANL